LVLKFSSPFFTFHFGYFIEFFISRGKEKHSKKTFFSKKSNSENERPYLVVSVLDLVNGAPLSRRKNGRIPAIMDHKKAEIVALAELHQMVGLGLRPPLIPIQVLTVLLVSVADEFDLLVELGEGILLAGVVVDAAPVGKLGVVPSGRVGELDKVPFAHAVAELGLGVLVDGLRLLRWYEGRLVAVVFGDEAPDLAVNSLRTLDWLDQAFELFLQFVSIRFSV